MPSVHPSIQTFARIKIIGVGGSGHNAVNHMIAGKIDGIEYICINTDTQDLHHSKADKKIHIGRNLTKGIGSGMNPDIGRKAAEETKAEIQEALKGADMVFIACGMGGGTGTGASPVIARLAREAGALTIGVITRPFAFEGEQRGKIAREGIEELQKEVDSLIVISNDRLLAITEKNVSFKQAFAVCDEVLLQAVKSVAEIIREKQVMNIDFADVRAVLSNAGSAFIGIGVGTGENRAVEAATEAINSPLLDVSIAGAKGVLLSIATHPDDLKIHEVDEIARVINESIDQNAKFIFGPVEDNKLKKGEIKVTVIATGFDQRDMHRSREQRVSISSTRPTADQTMQASPQIPRHTPTSTPTIEDKPTPAMTVPPKIEISEPDIETIDDTRDDEWLNIPGFMRRKK